MQKSCLLLLKGQFHIGLIWLVYLHAFTYARKSAIASVAYLSQHTRCVLLGSKSKLSPPGKRTLTTPQLELNTMLLGSHFCVSLLEIVKKDFTSVQVCLWNDSEIILHPHSSPHKLKQFVKNKVDAINRLFASYFWSHTPSTENPANLISRGCMASN